MNNRIYEEVVERAFAAGIDDLAAFLRLQYQWFLEDVQPHPESPIEHALAVAMMAMSVGVPVFEFGKTRFDGPLAQRRAATKLRAPVECQKKIGNYRVDFLLTVLLQQVEVGKIVVECDGHDFHERTKEQAARDRSRDRELTTAGYQVLRFTGSEIYRQPMACAWSVFAAVDAIAERAKPE